MATFIVGAVLFGSLGLALYYIYRKHRQKRGDCSACSECDACESCEFYTIC